uniref:Matrix protein n=1 Tax=Chum salmon influenza-like virus TaxID=2777032 RepID=A0A866W085_9ORTO|nr:matrix protein [Chum salmon influenza-like virus]
MGTLSIAQSFLFATLPDNQIKAELIDKVTDWFGGRAFDLGSALEYVKNRNGVSTLVKALFGVVVTAISSGNPESTRRFILTPLNDLGNNDSRRKGFDLAQKKLKKAVTFNESFELAEGYEIATIGYAVREIYLNIRAYPMDCVLGTVSAICNKMVHDNQKSRKMLGRTTAHMVRHEHRMLSATNVLRSAEAALDDSEATRKMLDKSHQLIYMTRTMGTGGSEGLKEDMMRRVMEHGNQVARYQFNG